MRHDATNRQKKLLKFFKIPFGANISFGASGWEIDWLMSDEGNRELWRRYLYLTKDFDSDTDDLKPFDEKELEIVQVPEDWSSGEAIQEFRAELAASILSQQSPFDSPEPPVSFNGKTFVFTGKFDFGTRKECQEAVICRGGEAPKMKFVSQNVDYLVIGEQGSPAWKRGSYGNKIESAILARREHGTPAIISEKHWQTCIKGNDNNA